MDIEEYLCSAANANALAVATAKAFSDPTLRPAWVRAYAAAIASNGCSAVQPALARALLHPSLCLACDAGLIIHAVTYTKQ